jgi:RNA polymerase sigma factor (sigma-70 family)
MVGLYQMFGDVAASDALLRDERIRTGVRNAVKCIIALAGGMLPRGVDRSDLEQAGYTRILQRLRDRDIFSQFDRDGAVINMASVLALRACRDELRLYRTVPPNVLNTLVQMREVFHGGRDEFGAAACQYDFAAAYSRMGKLDRLVYYLRYVMGLSTREMGVLMGRSHVTIEKNLSRMRARVKEYLKEDPNGSK